METSVKFKNILILLLLFFLGVVCGVSSVLIQKDDIEYILESVRGEKGVEIAVNELEEESKEQVIQEVIQEVDSCPIRVDISGAVRKPGVYCLEKDSAVVDIVKKANGFTDGVAQKYLAMKINLATLLIDNSKIYIPFEEDSLCQLLEFKLPKEVGKITEPPLLQEEENQGGECVSINSASKDLLQTLNGVGPSTAQKVIDGRPYEKIEDILNVSGIGEVTYEKFKDMVCL